MLSPSEEQAFVESIDRVCRLASDRLGAIDDASHAVCFVANLHAGVDRVAANAVRSGAELACTPGCSYCCRAYVEATEPEVFLMARWVRRQPDAYVAGLLDRLRGRSAASTGGAVRPSCAFLVEDRCSAYEARPSTCRRAHSLSVAACASLAPEIPQNLKLSAESEALMIGTARAYANVRLSAKPRELNAAVLAALEDGGSEERWYAARSVARPDNPTSGPSTGTS
jgi:hypothetical protein